MCQYDTFKGEILMGSHLCEQNYRCGRLESAAFDQYCCIYLEMVHDRNIGRLIGSNLHSFDGCYFQSSSVSVNYPKHLLHSASLSYLCSGWRWTLNLIGLLGLSLRDYKPSLKGAQSHVTILDFRDPCCISGMAEALIKVIKFCVQVCKLLVLRGLNTHKWA